MQALCAGFPNCVVVLNSGQPLSPALRSKVACATHVALVVYRRCGCAVLVINQPRTFPACWSETRKTRDWSLPCTYAADTQTDKGESQITMATLNNMMCS